MVLSVTGRTLYGMVKDNIGAIERLTTCLLALKQDFDSAVASQTAIVSFRIHKDVSKMHACSFGNPHAPR
jgi:hypothetical protein